MKIKTVLFSSEGNDKNLNRVFAPGVIERVSQFTDLYPTPIGQQNIEACREVLSEVVFAFSTWGMPSFTGEEIDRYMPKLQAVFYAAGTVQSFARPFLERGIRVFSAWKANGISVIQWTVSEILLAAKGFFHSIDLTRVDYRKAGKIAGTMPGNYGITVGVLGAGAIGSGVIHSLKAMLYDSNEVLIKVYDPYLSEDKAKSMGVSLTSLEGVISCDIVTNHLANKEELRGLLCYDVLRNLPANGVFINTGRGAQVVEADLIRIMQEEPMRVAILDVTDPEPPVQDGPLLQQPNIFITPHMAGSSGRECQRLAHFMIDAAEKVHAQIPCDCEVTLSMLATMA
ncbi:MAG: NAD(P)-dependent oxidoreductase [Christensenellales bacterium]|jgi:phosphoglycerate dehydrogenase-like enzyme